MDNKDFIMWSIISKILLNIVLAIVSDKAVVEAGKKLITKGVDSAVKGVGITDEDAKHLIHEITRSTLNSIE